MMSTAPSNRAELRVEFCGDVHELVPGSRLTIGRDADLVVDDNPFLHRVFLVVEQQAGMWFVANVGSQLGATVAAAGGQMEAFLSPGASLPLVFESTRVVFTAGPTSYELLIENPVSSYLAPRVDSTTSGSTTLGPTRLTRDQRLLVIALAEPRLRGAGRASVELPSSAEAARRLGWTITKFNRKLDNVCDKLTKAGVRGLRGDLGGYASNRRARLAEYAIATRLVTTEDLGLLDAQMPTDDGRHWVANPL